MNEYYFVGAFLQELQLDTPPGFSFEELMQVLELNLTDRDLKKVLAIRRLFEIQQMRSLFRENLNEEEGEIPEYVSEYLEKYESNEERQKNFTELMSRFLKEEGACSSIITMERDSRLILTALRAKKSKRDIIKEIQHEDPDDDLIASILAQKDASTFDPPDDYADLNALYEEYSESPWDLNKAIVDWKFNKILEMEGIYPFSMDKILGYVYRLSLLENWFLLDEKKGHEAVDKILKVQ